MAVLMRPTTAVTGPETLSPSKRKVGFLGTYSRSLDTVPYDDPSWELHGHASGRGHYAKPLTAYWDLHRKECWTRSGKITAQYPTWLAKNTRPVMMQEKHPEVPGAVRYPKERVFEEWPAHLRYFTCHLSWFIAWALMYDVTHIGIWGVNYGATSEYATQRGGAQFWLGIAAGRGVNLVIPQTCSLLSDPKPLYGYESHDEHAKLVPAYQALRVLKDVEKQSPPRLFPPDEVPLAKPPDSILGDMDLERQEREALGLPPLTQIA